jgi:hypothetical protein
VVADHVPAGWDMGRVVSYVGAVDEIFPTRGADMFRAFKPFFASDFKFELKPALPAEEIKRRLKPFQYFPHGRQRDSRPYFGKVVFVSPADKVWPSEMDLDELDQVNFWALIIEERMMAAFAGLLWSRPTGGHSYFVDLMHDPLYASGDFLTNRGLFVARDSYKPAQSMPGNNFYYALKMLFAALILRRQDVIGMVEVLFSLYREGNFPLGQRRSEGTHSLYVCVANH